MTAFLKRYEHTLLIACAAIAGLIAFAAAWGSCQPRPITGISAFEATPGGVDLSRLKPAEGVVLASASTSLAMPAGGTAGGDVRGWHVSSGAAGKRDVVIFVTGTGATAVAGPACLWGSVVADGQAYQLGKLNGGSDITVGGATSGYAEKVTFVAAFDFLALGPCAGSATIVPTNSKSVTITAVPME